MNSRMHSQITFKVNKEQIKLTQTDPQLQKLVSSLSRDRTLSNIVSKNQNAFGNQIQSRHRLTSIKPDQSCIVSKMEEKNMNKCVTISRSTQFLHKQQIASLSTKKIHHGNYFYDKMKDNVNGEHENTLLKKMSQEALNQIHMIVTYQELIPEVTLLYQCKPQKKYRIAFDLDETLVHSEQIQRNRFYDFKNQDFGVFIRPHCQHILQELSQFADLFVFTSANQKYAKTIVQLLDPENKIFKAVYCRNHCVTLSSRIQIKHLGILSNDMSKVVLIDNSPIFYIAQPHNGIPITPFIDDKQDMELLKLLSFLTEKILVQEDVRSIIKRQFHYEMFRQFSDGVQAFSILYD